MPKNGVLSDSESLGRSCNASPVLTHYSGACIRGGIDENPTERGVIVANDFAVAATRPFARLGIVAHVRSFYLFVFTFWRQS